ncbi:MAG TPA: MauE/DoxX family redox-associated membrane protein [Planctomycetota bacterium]
MSDRIVAQRWNENALDLVMPITRLGLGGILLYAGVLKVPNSASFGEAIANYDLLPKQVIPLIAMTLPWVEILVGLTLLCGLWVRASASVSLLMFTVFSAAVISALARDLNIECGCFDTATGTRVGLNTVAIEGACMLASTLVLIFSRRSMIGLKPINVVLAPPRLKPAFV